MSRGSSELLPYWQVNVDPANRTDECPDFLLNVDDTDKSALGVLDKDFRLMNWERVKQIVVTNRIDLFRRVPSQLRKYLQYTAGLRQRYGSVMRFIVEERLRWQDISPKNPTPFVEREDYTFLYNDWPYGLVSGIAHLVVWVKFTLEEDPETGDMTEGTRASIDAFVAETFHPHVAPEDVTWFRNWSSLKSVHAIEHFHVMLNNPDSAFLKGITNGDIPLIDKV